MATITLNANYGKGDFKNLGLSFNSAKQNTSNLASSLQKLKSKVISVETVADAVAIGKPASTTVKNAEKREENKKSALSVAYKKLDQLLSDVGSIDDKVAKAITANKKIFYKAYPWLKPECEKGFFEKTRDYLWSKVCNISNAIKNTFIKVGNWLKENWQALLCVLAAIAVVVIAAIVCVLTFGTATPLIFALIAGVILGIGKQLISDLFTWAVTGEWQGTWQSYLGSALGGVANMILTVLGHPFLGNIADDFVSTMFSEGLESMTGGEKRSGIKILFDTGINVVVGMALYGLTSGMGKNYESSVKMVMTKMKKGTIKKIGWKTFRNLLMSQISGTGINGLTSGFLNSVDSWINKFSGKDIYGWAVEFNRMKWNGVNLWVNKVSGKDVYGWGDEFNQMKSEFWYMINPINTFRLLQKVAI